MRHLPDATSLALIAQAAEIGTDPLGIFRSDGGVVTRLTRDLAAAALARPGADMRDQHQLRGGRMARLDRTSAELLLHVGISPVALCVLAGAIRGRLVILDEDGVQCAVVDVEHGPGLEDCTTSVAAAAITWYAAGFLLAPGIPDTVMTIATGMPLARIVSHPVLDRSGATVLAAPRRIVTDDPVLFLDVDTAPLDEDAMDEIDARFGARWGAGMQTASKKG